MLKKGKKPGKDFWNEVIAFFRRIRFSQKTVIEFFWITSLRKKGLENVNNPTTISLKRCKSSYYMFQGSRDVCLGENEKNKYSKYAISKKNKYNQFSN